MMSTDGSSPGLALDTVQFDLDHEQKDSLHVRLIFSLSLPLKLNFRFAGLQVCRFADLHYDALLASEAPDYLF